MKLWRNLYDKRELAGAFGDLGTFIPFVVGYITVTGMNPVGILVSFGLFKIIVGLYFKTPMPVQPMKAIGGAAIAHPGSITKEMVWGSGIFTGLFWLFMALTGLLDLLAKITHKPVLRGITLGLGLGFIIQGMGMMKEAPVVAVAAGILTLFLLGQERVPAMLVLLLFGLVISLAATPGLAQELADLKVQFHLPEFALHKIGWKGLLAGTLILGIPQAPLTLGNAILGTVAENNQLFPERPVKAKQVALDHGLMNLVSAALGGVPLCHGAGGMAGHVKFGARTGGALVILGVLVMFTGLFLSDSVLTLFKMIPAAVLGVILFFAGVELATSIRDIKGRPTNLTVLVITAGTAMWNMGIAFATGILLYYAARKGLVKI